MFHIIYSNGVSNTCRGPFETLEEAIRVFDRAPVMPGHSAYLEDRNTGELLAQYDEPEDDEPEEFEEFEEFEGDEDFEAR